MPYDDGNDVDEDEKTTIESGWEEEPSTTVNESEVADKIASLRRPQAVTGVTATSVGASDEATVDDRDGHMNKMLAAVTPIAQPTRIVITGGNESGAELEVRPGKTYTIGRGVDNDIVLTDIAVSRKHFDLRYEQGQWLIVDRGSGNGTLVNGNLEDQPFALANGDAIEIGNTVFRFEQLNVNGAPRPKSPAKPVATMDVDMGDLTGTDDEEEEPSTVAGKPLRPEPEPMPAPPPPAMSRPKTLPPPTPRSRAATAVPIPPMAQISQLPPMPQLPRPRPVTAMPLAQEIAPIPSLPSPMMTIPGQGMPHAPSQPQILQSYPGYGYPPANDMPPPYMIHPNGGRDATASAVVAPYGSNPYAAQPAPALSRRTKMIMGGVGLTAFAAILTAAIVRSGSPPQAAQPDGVTQTATVQQTQPVVKPIEQPTVKPIEQPKPTVPPLKAAVSNTPVAPTPAPVVPKPAPAPTPPAPKPQVAVAPTPPPPAPKHVEAPPPPAPKHVEQPKHVVEEAPPPQPKRVAAAPSGGADAAKSKAAQQFAAKQFPAAISTLKSAAGNAGGDDAKELNQLARIYDQFARNYNVGMAPGTSPTDAYVALTKARNFDQQGAFKTEIEGRLGDVAAKAAASFMGKGQFAEAAAAVRLAESVGGGNSTTKSVRSGLESKAADLYNSASKEMPAETAKEKLRTVTKMVDAKSQWYQKATKLLASAG